MGDSSDVGDSRILVAPSPNWYAAHVADLSFDGSLFAYAAHSYAIVVRPSDGRILSSLSAHRNRVTAVAFLRQAHLNRYLVTGSTDKAVIVWDVGIERPLKPLSGHRAEVTCLAPLVSNPHCVASLDAAGVLFVWNVHKSERPIQKASVDGVCCMAAVEVGRGCVDVLACGCKNGDVLLLDASSGQTTRAVGMHDHEVCAIRALGTHSPASIATSSRSGQIKILALTDPDGARGIEQVASLSVPKPGAAEASRAWTTCSVSRAAFRHGVIWSDPKGSTWLWRVGSDDGGDAIAKIYSAHNRPIFSICIAPWHARGIDLAISCSMDRHVACWECSRSGQSRERWRARGFGGHPSAVNVSRGVLSEVAVGCGDKSVRLYRESEESESLQETHFIWSGVGAKVLHTSFHPGDSDVVVFYTDDKTMGVYDKVGDVNACVRLTKHDVAKCMWRSQEEGDGTDAIMYSLDDSGFLFKWHHSVHQWASMDEEDVLQPVSLPHGIQGTIKAFGWCNQGKLLAVGTDAKHMHCFSEDSNGDLEAIAQTACHPSAVSCVCVQTKDEDPGHETAATVVLGHADGKLTVVSLKGAGVDCGHSVQILDPAHKSIVVGIQFNPFSQHFASGAADGTLVIWTVRGHGVSKHADLRGHHAGILSVAWSLKCRGNYLYTASEDQTLRCWNVFGRG